MISPKYCIYRACGNRQWAGNEGFVTLLWQMPVTIKMLLDQYTEILRKVYGSHLKTVILYGSYARGDYRADSDIDIMILLELSDIQDITGEYIDTDNEYMYYYSAEFVK